MLNDLLMPGLRLVICGTAASSVSATNGHYYAGPGNKFWRVLHAIGLTDRRLEPGEYELLLDYGIGLTDVIKRQSGIDSEIDFAQSDPQAVQGIIKRYAPGILAFNGKKAAQVFLCQKHVDYGLQAERMGATKLFVAPSTSGAANRFWNVDHWCELADRIRASDS